MSEWQPIETAPKDGTVILVAHSTAAFDAYWDDEEGAWVDGSTNLFDELKHFYPTHWMPMPPLPTDAQ